MEAREPPRQSDRRTGNNTFETNALAASQLSILRECSYKMEPDGSFCVEVRQAVPVGSMDRLLRRLLGRFIRRGSITFTTAGGQKFTCGDGTGLPVSARFVTKRAQRRILLHPELALGEAFMDGSF